MRMRRLPHSKLVVSEISLGTMMFGDQVDEKNAFEQLDMAVNRLGINFIVSL